MPAPVIKPGGPKITVTATDNSVVIVIEFYDEGTE